MPVVTRSAAGKVAKFKGAVRIHPLGKYYSYGWTQSIATEDREKRIKNEREPSEMDSESECEDNYDVIVGDDDKNDPDWVEEGEEEEDDEDDDDYEEEDLNDL